MMQVAYLCAVLSADISCTPFADLAACHDARAGLASALVERAECAEAEVLDPSAAPLRSPIPIPRPTVGQDT